MIDVNFFVCQASDSKHEVSKERQTRKTGEGTEKVKPVHTPLFVLFCPWHTPKWWTNHNIWTIYTNKKVQKGQITNETKQPCLLSLSQENLKY